MNDILQVNDDVEQVSNDILQVNDVYKSYTTGKNTVEVLKGISFCIAQGKKAVITGESGSGKTTLLSVVSGLDNINSGSILIKDAEISKAKENARAKIRLAHIGFVFQHHYLLQDFTALGNVMIPLVMLGYKKSVAKEKSLAILERVGLTHRKNHFPTQMSGGECQRTAIARALVHSPALVLADEPTGALDNKNSENIREILSTLVEEQQTTLLIATHDTDFISIADMHWHFEEGVIVEA